jgi:hypothetical protein
MRPASSSFVRSISVSVKASAKAPKALSDPSPIFTTKHEACQYYWPMSKKVVDCAFKWQPFLKFEKEELPNLDFIVKLKEINLSKDYPSMIKAAVIGPKTKELYKAYKYTDSCLIILDRLETCSVDSESYTRIFGSGDTEEKESLKDATFHLYSVNRACSALKDIYIMLE